MRFIDRTQARELVNALYCAAFYEGTLEHRESVAQSTLMRSEARVRDAIEDLMAALVPPEGGTMSENLNERRARFIYEAARLAAIAAQAPIVPEPWDEREPAFRAQMLPVIERQCGPDRCMSPEQLHDDWVEAYKVMGWRHGPVRDRDAKTHPDMVPYWELGQLERDKDAVFVALCEIARQWIYEPPKDEP